MRKYENFCKALKNLEEGAKLEGPYTVVEQTGIVALFEICFEQAWKLMKVLMEEQGLFENKIGSPRAIIKMAYQCGMIDNEEEWLSLLAARNLLAHTYSDEQSLGVIARLKSDFLQIFRDLKTRIDEAWR